MINKEFMSTAAVGVALAFSSMVFAPNAMAESDCSQFPDRRAEICEAYDRLEETEQEVRDTTQEAQRVTQERDAALADLAEIEEVMQKIKDGTLALDHPLVTQILGGGAT